MPEGESAHKEQASLSPTPTRSLSVASGQRLAACKLWPGKTAFDSQRVSASPGEAAGESARGCQPPGGGGGQSAAHKELSAGEAHFRHTASSLVDNYSSEVSRLFESAQLQPLQR